MSLIPVEGNSSLYRDAKTGAILNCSDNDFNAYLETKKIKIKEIEEIEKLKNQVGEIDKLKSDVNDIKNMMQLILSKLESNS